MIDRTTGEVIIVKTEKADVNHKQTKKQIKNNEQCWLCKWWGETLWQK